MMISLQPWARTGLPALSIDLRDVSETGLVIAALSGYQPVTLRMMCVIALWYNNPQPVVCGST